MIDVILIAIPGTIKLDFEEAMTSALEETFAQVKIHGCYLYFG